jgi:hypothetical protein
MGAAKVLWVEGRDEEVVLPILCESKGINLVNSLITLKDKEGYTNLLKGIPLEIKSADSEGLEILGIIIDADENAGNRWNAVRNRLSEAGYKNLPKNPKKEGTIIPGDDDNDLPTVGVWLMPDNEAEGMLETLISFLVKDRPTNLLWQCAEQSTNHVCDNHTSFKSFSPAKKPKAVLHTWLAWQKKPGMPIGTAITATYLNSDDPAIDDFITWIKRLFQLP